MTVNAVSARGRDLIKQFEGCRLEAYRDSKGIATIGYGHTEEVFMGQKIDQPTADQFFERDIDGFAMRVRACIHREPTQEQFDAMCSLAFNIGIGGFKDSTVCRRFDAGDDIAAANAFGMWNKIRVNGALTESPGLARRRAAEKALYLEGVPQESAQALAEVVPEQKTLKESGTVKGGVGAGIATAATAVTAMIQQGQDFLMQIPWVGQAFQFVVREQPKLMGVFAVGAAAGLIYMVWRRIHDHERLGV